MANLVENIKESAGRVVAWAKAHPKTAAGIAVVLVGIGVYLYIRARNSAGTTGSTSQDLTPSGGGTVTNPDGGSTTTTTTTPTDNLPTPTVINGPPTNPDGGSTTTTTTTTTPTIPLDGLGPIGGYDNTPIANNNNNSTLGVSGGSTGQLSQGIHIMTADTSASVGANQSINVSNIGQSGGSAGASSKVSNIGQSGGSAGASSKVSNIGQSGGSAGASSKVSNIGQSGGSAGAVTPYVPNSVRYGNSGGSAGVSSQVSNIGRSSGSVGAVTAVVHGAAWGSKREHPGEVLGPVNRIFPTRFKTTTGEA